MHRRCKNQSIASNAYQGLLGSRAICFTSSRFLGGVGGEVCSQSLLLFGGAPLQAAYGPIFSTVTCSPGLAGIDELIGQQDVGIVTAANSIDGLDLHSGLAASGELFRRTASTWSSGFGEPS